MEGRHGRNKDGRLVADLTSSKTKSRLGGIGRLCHASKLKPERKSRRSAFKRIGLCGDAADQSRKR
jgi:hypothetical protein